MIKTHTSDLSIRVRPSGMCKQMFYLTIVNKCHLTVTLGWHDSRNRGFRRLLIYYNILTHIDVPARLAHFTWYALIQRSLYSEFVVHLYQNLFLLS